MARLKRDRRSAAKALPGVHAVLTFADLRPLLTSDRIPQALPSGAIRFDVDPYVLAKDEVTYVGEPVAMVVAESRRVAEDALALIALDLEPLPAVLDPVAGLASGAPKARLDCPDNLVARQSIDYGDIDGAFARAAHRISERFRLHKGGGHSIETRGIAVRLDPTDDTLTIFVNTPDAASRARRSWSRRSASPSSASAWSRPTPAAALGRRRRSIPRSWRCRRRRSCCAGR